MRKSTNLDKDILVYSGNVLADTMGKCIGKIELSDNTALILYEGDFCRFPGFMAVTVPLGSVPFCSDFSENERTEIGKLARENGLSRDGTCVIKILQSEVEKQEIDLTGICFHEIRHVQQFSYKKDVYKLLCEQLESSTSCRPDRLDMKFEQDAIIYSRDKLREVGFPEDEIKLFLRKHYPSFWEYFMTANPITISEVADDAKVNACRK